MKVTTRKWDASEYLDSPEMINEYLKAAFEEGDFELLIVMTNFCITHRSSGRAATAHFTT